MKHTLFVILALCMLSGTAYPVKLGKPIFYVNSGLTFPSSPELFCRYWNRGFNVGGGVGYRVMPTIVVQGYVDYHRLPFDLDQYLSDLGVANQGADLSGGSVSIWTASLNMRMDLTKVQRLSACPYILVGLGYSRVSTASATFTYPNIKEDWDGNEDRAVDLGLGGGVDIRLNRRLSLFLEGKLGIAFTQGESTQYIPWKMGISLR